MFTNQNSFKGKKPLVIKEEGEMTLFPFEKKKTQKSFSVIAIIIGIFLMVSSPTGMVFNIGVTVSGFILGLLIAFTGFFYLMDVQ